MKRRKCDTCKIYGFCTCYASIKGIGCSRWKPKGDEGVKDAVKQVSDKCSDCKWYEHSSMSKSPYSKDKAGCMAYMDTIAVDAKTARHCKRRVARFGVMA